jgi:hypothetical protein
MPNCALRIEGSEKHLIFYRQAIEHIEIVRVLRGPRDLDTALGRLDMGRLDGRLDMHGGEIGRARRERYLWYCEHKLALKLGPN